MKSRLGDFDPEQIDFDERTVANRKGKRAYGDAHYGDVASRKRRLMTEEEELGEGKYRGEKTNRRSLGLLPETTVEVVEPSEAEISFEDDEKDEPKQSMLLRELANLSKDGGGRQDLIMQERRKEQIQSGEHVRNQLCLWDRILDIRISTLQPLLTMANRLPGRPEELAALYDQNANVANELQARAVALTRRLLQAQRRLCRQDGIGGRMARSRGESLEETWRDIARLQDQTILPFCREMLESWHQKMVLSATPVLKKSAKRKQLTLINQSAWTQVDLAMSSSSSDPDRLFRRTRQYRGTEGVFGEPNDCLFDDGDFYSTLLAEWLDAHPSDARLAAVRGVVGASSSSNKNDHHRGSKGRRLRYDVHEKLVNYMVPSQAAAMWPDTKTDELYASLLR